MSEEYYTATASDAPSRGMAIAGLIASILGITVVPTIGSIIGLILSYVARNSIRESDGEIGGEGIAKAGIIVGWIGIGLAFFGVCIGLAFLVFGVVTAGSITICAGLGNIFQ